jgi:hypothetical protein
MIEENSRNHWSATDRKIWKFNMNWLQDIILKNVVLYEVYRYRENCCFVWNIPV